MNEFAKIKYFIGIVISKGHLDFAVTSISAPDVYFDLNLVNRARKETERLVDELYKIGDFETKLMTCRHNARKEYLGLSKKRTKVSENYG